MLKGQLKEMVERPLDGTLQEFRDRGCLTISGEDEANREETVEVIQLTPHENVFLSVSTTKNVNVSGEQDVEVVKVVPQERLRQHTVERIIEVPVPQIVEEIVGVVEHDAQERVQERTVEQVVDVPV